MCQAVHRGLIAESKQSDDAASQQPNGSGDDKSHSQGERDGLAGTKFDAIYPPRTDVLSRLGGKGRLESIERDIQVLLNATSDCKRCCHGLSKAIHHALNERQANGNDH